MIKLDTIRTKCFAITDSGCRATSCACDGRESCPFYKPEGCEDWIRIEYNGEVWLVPPEEYYGEKELRILR